MKERREVGKAESLVEHQRESIGGGGEGKEKEKESRPEDVVVRPS